MNETGANFDTYTRLYKEQWGELMQSQDQKHMPMRIYSNGSVATTWMISYTAIRTRNEVAANLLLLWAHLDNRSLWHSLLAGASQKSAIAANRISVWLKEIVYDEMEFIRAIGVLRSYSLVEQMQGQTGYAMHPVVHRWALDIQDEEQRAELSWIATVIVGLAVPSTDEKKYWEMQMRLLAHVERCKRSVEQTTKDRLDEHRSELLKNEDVVLLRAIHNLGYLYSERGRLKDAEEMYMQALEGRERALGADHPSTLNTVSELGIIYSDQGKLHGAEKMYNRALEGRKKTLGADHTSTLNTFNSLGSLYTNQGKLDRAEKMYNRALEGYEKALGAEHTLTLNTVNNLGRLYTDQGKLGEAENMYMRALEGYKKALGADHIWTLNTVNDLGRLYADQGKLDEAENMCMRALEGYKKALGSEHTSTLYTVNDLGRLYAQQGKLDEAENMCMRALEGCKKALGADHIWTLYTVNDLGRLYAQQGKLDEAENMYMRALEGYEKALGLESTLSFMPALNTMWGLASLFERQNRAEDARVLYSKVLSGYQEVVGDDHPSCQTLRDDLAALAKEGDDISTATEMESVPTHGQPVVGSSARRKPPISRRHKVLRVLGWKRS
jgi:tetratricopeptide (TPR) repeat protein